MITFRNKLFSYEFFSTVLLIVFFSPLLFSLSECKFLMHDNLDSNVVWIKNLVESGKMFAGNFSEIKIMMLGIPRACYPSEWAVDRLIFLMLPTQFAMALNYILQHTLAFIGMRLLIKTSISPNPAIYNLVALAFAFLPFWPSGFLTVAGLPLLVFALISIYTNKATWLHWTILILFPFCSSLLFGNLFSYPLLFVSTIVGLSLKYWRLQFKILAPFILLFILTIFVENRIISLMLQGFESNRSADVQSLSEFMNYKGIIGTSILAFAFGHYHFHSLHVIILALTIITLVVFVFKKQKKDFQQLVLIIGTIFFLCFIMIFLDNFDLRSILGNNYKRVEMRFWVILPMAWYLILAFISNKWILLKKSKMVKAVLFFQLVFNMSLIYPYDYFGSRHAENVFANSWLYSNNAEQETLNNYYRVSEMQHLKQEIHDIDHFPVACIGLNPEIFQFNKISTLEGYFSFYPASKRRLIQSVDSQERLKSKENLDKHSNRNYLFINDKTSQIFPAWNIQILKSHHIKYIISSKQIIEMPPSVFLKDVIDYLYVYQIK